MLTEDSASASAPVASAPGSASPLRLCLKRRNKPLRRRTLYAQQLFASYSHDDLVAAAAQALAGSSSATSPRFRGGSDGSYGAEPNQSSDPNKRAENHSFQAENTTGTSTRSPVKRRMSPSHMVALPTTANAGRKQRLVPYYYLLPRANKRRSIRCVDDSASASTSAIDDESSTATGVRLRRKATQNATTTTKNDSVVDLTPPHEFHLSDFLYKEIFGVYDIKQTDDLHQERVQNFLLVPFRLEKLMFLGIFLTLDSFLYVFTYLPLRLLYALGSLWMAIVGGFSWIVWPVAVSLRRGAKGGRTNPGLASTTARSSMSPKRPSASSPTRVGGTSSTTAGNTTTAGTTTTTATTATTASATSSSTPFAAAFQVSSSLVFRRTQVYDLLVAILMAFGTFVLSRVDMSRLYHAIRGQAMIKLYVLFTMIEILDRLFCSLGQDIVNALYYTVKYQPRNFRRVWVDLTVAITYVVLHSLLLFAQVVTINVAINSSNASLLTLLLSNNFAELKSSVFKRFEEWNLFQISCSDIVERFKLLLFLGLIALQSETKEVMFGMVMVMLAEMLIDWIKHAFITKFNSIPPSIYSKFLTILCRDLTGWQNENTILDHTHHVSRRLGLVSFPLACVVLRMVLKTIASSTVIQSMSTGGFALVTMAFFLCLVALKMLLSLVLMIYAIHSKRL